MSLVAPWALVVLPLTTATAAVFFPGWALALILDEAGIQVSFHERSVTSVAIYFLIPIVTVVAYTTAVYFFFRIRYGQGTNHNEVT